MISLIALAFTLTHSTTVAPSYEYTSRYLAMRDGIRIAVDLYLPKRLAAGTKLPTIIHQTRYFRAHRVAFPANLFWHGSLEPGIARYVARGYAYVVVDARGSGASFGTRTQEWSPDEVRDGAEVVSWIVAQPWSNGRVGSTGVSYDGTAADFLVSNGHPAVQAAAPQSGLFDAYADVAFPGGLKQAPFIAFWSRAVAAQDSNRFNSMLTGIAKLMYRGVKPVQSDTDESLLAAAVRGHTGNYNVAAAIGRFEFSDESGEAHEMSPYTKRAQLEASRTPIYSISGWYDGALMNSAIKRFLSVRTPGSRLLLGAWSHQGENLSPFATLLNDFDRTADIMRFFDRALKQDTTGPAEPAVRYYTVGEERWKTASTWPPPGTTTQLLHLGPNGSLEATPSAAGADQYSVDFTAGSGQESRWNNQTALDLVHTITRDRRERDRKLLVYTGRPLAADLEMTGHPMVTLYLQSTDSDGAVFVYLEDVEPDGNVRYVTEGMLRLLQRRTSTGPAPYEFPAPYRTFAKGDAWPLEPGATAEIGFDLFPISYLFRASHAIRVSIAGADADHFARIPAQGPPPTLTILRDASHPSHIEIPVMRR